MSKKQNLRKRSISWYGWKPDLPDPRDFAYTASMKTLQKLPKKIDLSPVCPPVYNQGQLGSCTSHAIAGAIQFELLKQNPQYNFMPSRLFIYYNERLIEGTTEIDNGAEIRNGIKTVNKQGVCHEKIWKYNEGRTQFKKRPDQRCYMEALKHQVLSYHRIERNLDHMRGCLAEGYPFIFGFTVYDEFEGLTVERTGVLNMPRPKERVQGGHAVLCVGYDDTAKRFIVRNSWGSDWGRDGYFTMPYEYLTQENLAEDFWTIRMMEINQ